MRVETATRKLDRRRHCEDPEERSRQQLERHHPFVSAKKDPGKHHPANLRGSRSATEKNEQAGFRKGRGFIDQVFTLKNIIEQCTEWQRQL